MDVADAVTAVLRAVPAVAQVLPTFSDVLVPQLHALAAESDRARAETAATTSDQAASLNNWSVRLAGLGRHDEALAPIERAVELRGVGGRYRGTATLSRRR